MRITLLLTLLLFQFSAGSQNELPYSNCNCASNLDDRFFRIQHFHKINNHSKFGNKELIAQVCSSTEFISEIRVAADGTTSTFLEITRESCDPPAASNYPFDLIQLDDNFEQVGNSLPTLYGVMEKVSKNGSTTFFKYTHPLIGPDEGLDFRSIYVQIVGTNATLGTMIISVRRPPVLMVHGLWSNGTAFDAMKSNLTGSGNYQDFQLYSANYESTNDRQFIDNTNVIPDGIFNVIKQSQDRMVAVGKVNIVCHSMGGILTRLYMKNPLYAQNKDINRVITCNTPHAGSQMANFVLDNTQYGNVIASALAAAGMNSYAGAVSDLRVGYPEINGVRTAAILGDAKVHAILTVTDPLSSPRHKFFPKYVNGKLCHGLYA
ncbi:MAG: hypothetical protein IPN29_06710 [Saprospiraceae bacterium]|nr:hypothetical protein [Saprospiraceae bacterium]